MVARPRTRRGDLNRPGSVSSESSSRYRRSTQQADGALDTTPAVHSAARRSAGFIFKSFIFKMKILKDNINS